MMDGLFSSGNYQMARELLDVAASRHRALAGNLANVETPGYQRIDVSQSFTQKLQGAIKSGDATQVKALEIELARDPNARAVRADGNNVQLDKELLEINRNAANYEYLTQRVSSNLRQLRSAITGKF